MGQQDSRRPAGNSVHNGRTAFRIYQYIVNFTYNI